MVIIVTRLQLVVRLFFLVEETWCVKVAAVELWGTCPFTVLISASQEIGLLEREPIHIMLQE